MVGRTGRNDEGRRYANLHPRVSGGAMHLLEREQQLATLAQGFSEARAGAGKLILIAGEAGLGKSALVEQFVADTRRHARILWGACDALDRPGARGPVHEIAAPHKIGACRGVWATN